MRLGVASLALCWLFGCAASSEKGSSGNGADKCKGGDAARDRVLTVVNANLACSTDDDCVTVNVGATCFDACTRNVNQTGKGAVDRVTTLVEAGECKSFTAAHCALGSLPPCAPPSAPHCNAGKCE